jgi:hypothetical protein
MKRTGRLSDPDAIPEPLNRTAARAYWKWVGGHYDERLSPVHKAIYFGLKRDIRDWLGRLRMHSLVPPAEGKLIPMRSPPINHVLPGAPVVVDENSPPRWSPPVPKIKSTAWENWELRWIATKHWTLHLPLKGAAPHVDPCADCNAIELYDEQLQVVAEAFYKAWGRERTPMQMPPELFLFGQPPLTSVFAAPVPSAAGSIVALVPNGALCDNVEHLHGSATPGITDFVNRMQDRVPDTVVVDRRLAKRQPDAVLHAISAWLAAPSDQPEGDAHEPTADPPGSPES